MSTKIRLARHGRKDYAYYHIVVADSRSPRDGRIIERIGSYNPNTNPYTVDLNFERALYWINVGAQPTDTVKNILSDCGVLLMRHLNKGVQKGAFDEAEAQRRFEAWKAEKEAKRQQIMKAEEDKKRGIVQKLLDQENETNKVKAEALRQKRKERAEALAKAAQEAAQEAAAAEQEGQNGQEVSASNDAQANA